MNNHKLIRRTLSSTTTGNEEQEEEQSQYTKSVLVFLGYNETTGKPMYIEPCVSNDNPNPYETIPKCLNLLDGLDNEGGSESIGRPSWSNSDNVNEEIWYEYECINDYCNDSMPGSSGNMSGGSGLDGTSDHDGGGTQEEKEESWSYIDTCFPSSTCSSPYDTTYQYDIGDLTSISTTTLNSQVTTTSVSCPGSGAALGEDDETSPSSNTNNSEKMVVVVPYVYTVESTRVSSAYTFLPRLEERILFNLADSMMNCLDDANGEEEEEVRRLDVVKKNQEGNVVQRRLDMVKNTMNVRMMAAEEEETTTEEFSVIGIESEPDDVPVEGPCTITSPNADACFIISGQITLLLDPTSYNNNATTASAIESAATDMAQYHLQDAMINDELLSSNNMPEVIKVRWLGDTYGWTESGLSNGGNGNGIANGGGSTDNNNGTLLWTIVGATLGALLVILLSILFINKRRRDAKEGRRSRGGDLNSQAVGMDFDWDVWDDESYDDTGGGVAGLGSRVNGEITFHVGNLGPNTTKEDIVHLFQQANDEEGEGKVNNCIIPQDHLNSNTVTNNDPSGRRTNNNQDSGRFALLTMPATTQDEVNTAMNACKHVNGHELHDCGNILSVREVTTLYVGNLSPRTNENGLCNLFEEHGLVTGCIIPADHNNAGRMTGMTRTNNNNNGRFALITMPINDAQSAITHLHGMNVDGNVITVRDIQYMNGGRGLPGGGLAAAALAAGAVGAVAAFNPERNVDVTLHVSNMNPSTSRGDIEDLFSGYGAVQECIIPYDEEDGRGGGGGVSNNNNSSMNRFALVTMPAEEAFNACNELNGYELDGYKLRVREARSYGRNGIGGGMRNLMDDTVSDYDASYDCRRRKGVDETPPGALAALGAMGAFIGGMILFKPCRKDSEKDTSAYDGDDNNDDLDAGLDDVINNIDGVADAHDRRNFVVDPPGAFHMGKHHYTGDGVRYFSPLCEQCIAARADADGVVALAVNGNEYDDLDLNDTNNDLSFDLEAVTKFTDFNSNDLGRYHSSMHVRHCKSTTCAICIKEKGVFFVKSRKELSADAAGGSMSREVY